MKSKQIQEFKETEIGKSPADWDVKRLEEVTLLITDGKHGDCKNQENSQEVKQEAILPGPLPNHYKGTRNRAPAAGFACGQNGLQDPSA